MSQIKVDFYEDAQGNAPVERFLDSLRPEARAKALALIQILRSQGVAVPFPYSSQVKGRIRELRTQYGKEKIRILYYSDTKRVFILLHGIVKRTRKLENSDIRTAEERMTQHELRLGGQRK